jgi:hypothetical protein
MGAAFATLDALVAFTAGLVFATGVFIAVVFTAGIDSESKAAGLQSQ